MNFISQSQLKRSYGTLQSHHVGRILMVFNQKVSNGLVTKSPIKVMFHSEFPSAELLNILSRSRLFSVPRRRQNFSLLPNSLRNLSLKQNVVLYILDDSKLFSSFHPPVWSGKQRGILLTLADCCRKFHVTKYFLRFLKRFFWIDDDSWIFNIVSDL